jgi:hypothetical protein
VGLAVQAATRFHPRPDEVVIMARFGLFSLALSFAAVIGMATIAGPADAADPACKRAKFETKLVKEACAKGGQKAAKDVMKTFLKEGKKKQSDLACDSCHTKLAPDYPLKPNALKLFKELGGT